MLVIRTKHEPLSLNHAYSYSLRSPTEALALKDPFIHMQRTAGSQIAEHRRSLALVAPTDPPRADDADEAIVSRKAEEIGITGDGGHSAVAADCILGAGPQAVGFCRGPA
jgi:hypothetical protein